VLAAGEPPSLPFCPPDCVTYGRYWHGTPPVGQRQVTPVTCRGKWRGSRIVMWPDRPAPHEERPSALQIKRKVQGQRHEAVPTVEADSVSVGGVRADRQSQCTAILGPVDEAGNEATTDGLAPPRCADEGADDLCPRRDPHRRRGRKGRDQVADNGLAGGCYQDECVRIRDEVGAPVRTVRFRPRRIAQVIACCTVLCEQRCAGRGEASDVADSRLPDLDLVHLANDKPGDSPSNEPTTPAGTWIAHRTRASSPDQMWPRHSGARTAPLAAAGHRTPIGSATSPRRLRGPSTADRPCCGTCINRAMDRAWDRRRLVALGTALLILEAIGLTIAISGWRHHPLRPLSLIQGIAGTLMALSTPLLLIEVLRHCRRVRRPAPLPTGRE